jgi:hypothetical protein
MHPERPATVWLDRRADAVPCRAAAYVAPLSECGHPNTKFKNKNSKCLPNTQPCSATHKQPTCHDPTFTCQHCTLCLVYLYKKDEREMCAKRKNINITTFRKMALLPSSGEAYSVGSCWSSWGCPVIEISLINRTQLSRHRLKTEEEPSSETSWFLYFYVLYLKNPRRLTKSKRQVVLKVN